MEDRGMAPDAYRYPKTPFPAESLAVVDLGDDRLDGQVAACVLQGLVNRSSSEKVYVLNTYCQDNRGGGRRQARVSERFLAELFGDIPAARVEAAGGGQWPGFTALVKRFGAAAKGLVVWDPALEQATIEAATTVAAQTDAIAVSPDLLEAMSGSALPVVCDLRERGFVGNVECLEWLLAKWFGGAHADTAFTWSHMTTDEASWGASNKDYVVAHKLFTYYLDIAKPEERRHYADVVARYAPGTPVMGWTDERHADALFASLGCFMVPFISVENLTVHSSFPSRLARYAQSPPQPSALRDDGVYIAFYVADGDNLEHSLVYEPDTIMASAAYGSVPATWIVNPGMVDLSPRLFEWYLSRLGTQELGAMMGDGHPSSDRYAGFSSYCAMAREYLMRSGIRTLKQMGEAEAVAWNVRPYVINSGYAGTDSRGIGPYEYHLDAGTFHVGSVELKEGGDLLRRTIAGAPKGRPLFLNVFSGTASGDAPALIKRTADALRATEAADERTYFFVRSVDLAATYRAWRGLPVDDEGAAQR
jgi:hypothetical protein